MDRYSDGNGEDKDTKRMTDWLASCLMVDGWCIKSGE
jgi:hypothetical protein